MFILEPQIMEHCKLLRTKVFSVRQIRILFFMII